MQEKPSPKITQSVPKEDRVAKTKTMYDVGFFEMVWRNFVTGMSRALGSIFVYVAIIVFVGFLGYRLVVPYMQPYIATFNQAIGTIEKMNQSADKIEQSKNDLEETLNLENLEKLFE